VLLLAMSISANAQWVQTNGPYGGNATCVASINNYLLVGTAFGGIFRSTDSGQSWRPVNVGMGLASAISILAIDDLFLASSSGSVFRSTDFGISWSPSHSGLYDSIGYVLLSTKSFVFASTNYGFFRSTDKGINWSKSDSGLSDHLVANISQIGNDLFAQGNEISKSTDNGLSWERIDTITLFIGDGRAAFTSMCSLGQNLYVGAYGTNGPYFTGSGIFRSTDKGKTWSLIENTNFSNKIHSILSLNSILFATTDGGISQSDDSGKTWKGSSKGLTDLAVNTLGLFGNGTYIACTNYLGVFRSTDNGIDWKISNTGLAGVVVNAITTNGKTILAGTNGLGVARSTDSGETWEYVNSGLRHLYIESFAFHEPYFFVGTDSGIYRSGNDGLSWELTAPGISDLSIYALKYLDSNIYAGTSFGIFRTNDDGITWTRTQISNHIDALAGFKHVVFAGDGEGGIFSTTNHGIDWQILKTGFTYDPSTYALAMIGQNLFAATDRGILFSSDFGITWKKRKNISSNFIAPLLSIGNSLFTVDGINIVMTSNLGLSWHSVNPEQIFEPTVLDFDTTYIFAASYGQGVWRRQLSDFSIDYNVDQVLAHDNYTYSISLSPNPNFGAGTISYQLPSSTHVTISVYDLLGREVEHVTDKFESEGAHEERFDLSDQPGGTYFIVLRTDASTEVRSLVVAR
jgi:photosystem II stability/assembly factor-like uncharacterized protein